MAYTTPRTWVAGEIATAANLNTHVRDNIAWLATDSPAASAHRTTTQSIANNTDTLVQLNNTLFDNASMHSNVTNNDSHVIPSGGGGKYLVTGIWNSAYAASLSWLGSVAQNSRTAFTNKVFYAEGRFNNTSGTGVVSCAASDYLACLAYQSSGSAQNIGGVADFSGTRTPAMAAYWFRT